MNNSNIKNMLKNLTPPVLWQKTSRAYQRFNRGGADQLEAVPPLKQRILLEQADISPQTLYYLAGEYGFKVSIKYLRYSGGLCFNWLQQPFMMYYQYGFDSLVDYYSKFQPKNIFQRHLLYNENLDKLAESMEQISLPWVTRNNKADLGEGGLPKEEGVQHYGPVSSKKLHFEKSRLDSILKSIADNGYDYSKGLPDGYFLLNKDRQYAFHVLGGQHRGAAMTHLGYEDVYVRFSRWYPRIISEDDILNWPAVSQGHMKGEEALEIFYAFFRDEKVSINNLIDNYSINI